MALANLLNMLGTERGGRCRCSTALASIYQGVSILRPGLGTILNADFRSTLAIMAPLSNLLSRATASSIVE